MCLPLAVQWERACLQRPPPLASCVLTSWVISIFCSPSLFWEKLLHGPPPFPFQLFWCLFLSKVSLSGQSSWTRVLYWGRSLDTAGGSKSWSATGGPSPAVPWVWGWGCVQAAQFYRCPGVSNRPWRSPRSGFPWPCFLLLILCAFQSSLLIILKTELKLGHHFVLEVKHDIRGNYRPHFQPPLRELSFLAQISSSTSPVPRRSIARISVYHCENITTLLCSKKRYTELLLHGGCAAPWVCLFPLLCVSTFLCPSVSLSLRKSLSVL